MFRKKFFEPGFSAKKFKNWVPKNTKLADSDTFTIQEIALYRAYKQGLSVNATK